MRDAVIVSTARTAIGKAYRGGFNATSGATLGSYSLKAAVARAGIEGGNVDRCGEDHGDVQGHGDCQDHREHREHREHEDSDTCKGCAGH